MTHLETLIQQPPPGRHLIRFAGDVLTLTLKLPHPMQGTARVRTNIGYAAARRREIIASVEAHRPFAGHDWYDVAMRRCDALTFEARLPLVEIGQFEAKCFFLPAPGEEPVWPPGENVAIKVEPADTCCANIIYNAFVRQFGPNREGKGAMGDPGAIEALDRTGFTVIPPSGTFRDLIAHLDFIFDRLGCRILQLLPIHPTPTTYARMGRFGSPYAALSFTEVDPALAVFDPAATPLEQFLELVDAVHGHEGRLLLDIAINHTGWAARLHGEHPEWLVRDPSGRIETPGAWGVVWADLTRLDYQRRDLWRYMAEVFLTWCRRGVDGFRCDAGYMIPLEAWRYIIAAVREQFPHTVFFLEGLGGKVSVTRALLREANFNWAYSELFQNYDRGQIEYYLPPADRIAEDDGSLVHFAETHDNNRLAARSHAFARLRTALCALVSHQGGFAFANGVEWLATEKIDVHGAPSLNWGAEPNLVDHLVRLHTLLRRHPLFHDRIRQRLVQTGQGNHLVVERRHIPTGDRIWIAANLDDRQPATARWHADIPSGTWVDLLEGAPVAVETRDGEHACALEPGRVRCLGRRPEDLEIISHPPQADRRTPLRVLDQRLRAVVLRIRRHFHGDGDLGDFRPEDHVSRLQADPEALCARLDPARPPVPAVTVWQWPRDLKRQVMIPPDHFILVRSERRFRVHLVEKERTLAAEDSLPLSGGGFFALLKPLPPVESWTLRELAIAVFDAGPQQRRSHGPLLFLPPPGRHAIRQSFGRAAAGGPAAGPADQRTRRDAARRGGLGTPRQQVRRPAGRQPGRDRAGGPLDHADPLPGLDRVPGLFHRADPGLSGTLFSRHRRAALLALYRTGGPGAASGAGNTRRDGSRAQHHRPDLRAAGKPASSGSVGRYACRPAHRTPRHRKPQLSRADQSLHRTGATLAGGRDPDGRRVSLRPRPGKEAESQPDGGTLLPRAGVALHGPPPAGG